MCSSKHAAVQRTPNKARHTRLDAAYTSRRGIHVTTRHIRHDAAYTSRRGIHFTTRHTRHDAAYTSRRDSSATSFSIFDTSAMICRDVYSPLEMRRLSWWQSLSRCRISNMFDVKDKSTAINRRVVTCMPVKTNRHRRDVYASKDKSSPS